MAGTTVIIVSSTTIGNAPLSGIAIRRNGVWDLGDRLDVYHFKMIGRDFKLSPAWARSQCYPGCGKTNCQ